MKKRLQSAAALLVSGLLIFQAGGVSTVLGQVRMPVEGTTAVSVNEKASIDASNGSEGYVIVKYLGGKDVRVKAQIAKQGGTTYTYDINANGQKEVLPITEGDGAYTVSVFEGAGGNKFALGLSTNLQIALSSQTAPFLYPNQYVNFNANSQTVQKAAELVAGAQTELEKITNIYNFTVQNITYDFDKASSVAAGYLPNVDATLASKKGICFDYAAIMTAMLRSQGIPTKLIVGYTGQVYHAWITTYVQDIGWVDNIIYFDGQSWKLMDPTFAATSQSNQKVNEYIGDGKNYVAKYAY